MQIIQHLASGEHRTKVEEYCRKFKADADRTLRSEISITKQEIRQYNQDLRGETLVEMPCGPVNSERVVVKPPSRSTEEFLSTVSDRLQVLKHAVTMASLF